MTNYEYYLQSEYQTSKIWWIKNTKKPNEVIALSQDMEDIFTFEDDVKPSQKVQDEIIDEIKSFVYGAYVIKDFGNDTFFYSKGGIKETLLTKYRGRSVAIHDKSKKMTKAYFVDSLAEGRIIDTYTKKPFDFNNL